MFNRGTFFKGLGDYLGFSLVGYKKQKIDDWKLLERDMELDRLEVRLEEVT